MQSVSAEEVLIVIVPGVVFLVALVWLLWLLVTKLFASSDPQSQKQNLTWLDLFWARFELKTHRVKLGEWSNWWAFQKRHGNGPVRVLFLDDANPGGYVSYRVANMWLARIRLIPDEMSVIIVTSRQVPAQIREFFRMEMGQRGESREQEILIFSIQNKADIDQVLSQLF